MKTGRITDTDHQLYERLAECHAAGLPFTFCGIDRTSKEVLLALLKKRLRTHAQKAPTTSRTEAEVRVLPDHA